MAKSATPLARPTFTSVLDMPAKAVERPKPLPVGQYIWVVQANYKMDKSKVKQTEYVEYTLKCLQPLNTVDEDALETWKENKDGTKRSLTDETKRLTFYLTNDAVFRLTDFMQHCGIDVENSDASIKQLIPEVCGCQVIGTITHSNSQDGQSIYANITSTAPTES